MDSFVSKGKGAVKAVEARLHGLVGVFKTLSEQHGEASALLRRAKRDPDKRVDLWPKIRQELVSHERAELSEVYPALCMHPETLALAERHEVEASQLSSLIDRIHTTEMSSTAWEQLFDQLIELVEQHAKEEENEIFPKAQETIGAARAKKLEPRFLAAKKQIAASL
jgi:hemerythrin superfamily protein